MARRTSPTIPIPFNPQLYPRKKDKSHAPVSIKPIPKTDWYTKALGYKEMLDKGVVRNKAESVRKEGVSRARITQIRSQPKNNLKTEKGVA